MVGIFPLAPQHDSLQYIHHVHLMQWGQNRGVTYTNSDDSLDTTFKLVSMGVAMALQSNISNIFKISTTYFPWLRKVSSVRFPYF